MDNTNRHLELITDSKDLTQQFLSNNVWSLLDYMVDNNNIEEFENMYKDYKKAIIIELMKEVRDKHTFLNIIEAIFYTLDLNI
jgi:hypothetical protein